MSKVQQVSRALRHFESSSYILESDSAAATGDLHTPGWTDDLPLIAHWALRVEKERGKGDTDDPLTWNYFAIVGKLDANGTRQFQYDRRQFYPDYCQYLGMTTYLEEDIDWYGRQKVKDAAPYKLILNNCQSFVRSLWWEIYNLADPNMELYRVRPLNNGYGPDAFTPNDYA